MANTCSYKMRIKGKRQDVIDTLHYIHGSGPLFEDSTTITHNKGMGDRSIKTDGHQMYRGLVGRCGYDSSLIKIIEKDGMMYADLDDECAWSVVSSMMENEGTNPSRRTLEQLAEDYDVQMEVYSVECGVGFSEYYFFPGKEIAEDGYNEEDFNHEEITEALKEDGYHWDDDKCEWCDKDGNAVPGLFSEKLDELFPWNWRVLCGDEWTGEGKEMNLLTFVTDYKGSWE